MKKIQSMRIRPVVAGTLAALFFGSIGSVTSLAQNENQGQGRAIITVLPKEKDASGAGLSQPPLKLEINGKQSDVTSWKPADGGLEVVVLIDSAARTTLGSQLDDIAKFIQGVPPNAQIAVAYMENGRAAMTAPFSTDRAAVIKGLHLPGGASGASASPYFCLSDLAKNWPSQNRNARREVVMVTDGVDYYSPRYDPDDPYVQAAVNDSVKAGLIVYGFYWKSRGRLDNTQYENNAGQNLLLEVTQATGGNSYWEGFGNPVSFSPYFDDLNRRLRNQYELSFHTRLTGKPDVASLKLKLTAPGVKIDAPEKVMVFREGTFQQ